MSNHSYTALLALLSLIFAASIQAADDLLIADFESDNYGQWKVEGKCFGPGPAKGTLPGQMPVDGFKGQRLVNSFFEGDGTTGSLTSPEFTVQRKYIAFLIGGGRNPDQLALQLLVGGRVVHSSTGPNAQAGGSESLAIQAWDVTELAGQTAVVKIIDNATGGWGHINVDHIVQTDQKPKGLLTDVTREFRVTQNYLHLPIRNDAPLRKVTLSTGGKAVVVNDIAISTAQPDWWAPIDVSSLKGQSVTLKVERVPEDADPLPIVTSSDEIIGADTMYREAMRGQFHFSPKRGWNNDPNGLAFFNGEYHMFFQHNPYGWGWGNMHWGHATSRDLIHWRELGDVLMPDKYGPMFSGSAVVDWKNTSGFGSDNRPPLVLIYTAAGNPTVQCIAYSLDGRTFTKYSENPVVGQVTPGNRDPKVFWHEPTKRWVMVLYVEKEKVHTIHIFTSENLKKWELASVVTGDPDGKRYLFECPDMFELPIDNDPKNKKWVLLAADSQYAIGQFDGRRFTPEAERLMGHQGRGFYAAQSYSDVPDGRRIFVGWFQTETKGMPFNQSMTIPLELGLTQTSDGPRLTFTPARELKGLRKSTQKLPIITLDKSIEQPRLISDKAELAEMHMELRSSDSGLVEFSVRGVKVSYDFGAEELIVNGHKTAAPVFHGGQVLTVYCDRTGLEVFACGGRTYVPMPVNIAKDNRTINCTVTKGKVEIANLVLHELSSAW